MLNVKVIIKSSLFFSNALIQSVKIIWAVSKNRKIADNSIIFINISMIVEFDVKIAAMGFEKKMNARETGKLNNRATFKNVILNRFNWLDIFFLVLLIISPTSIEAIIPIPMPGR